MSSSTATTIVADRLIRLPAVQHQTGLGRSQVYALAKVGKFPSPIKLSERCSAWSEHAVSAWCAARIAAAPASARTKAVA
jgi:prophage regulatory protein